MSTNNNTNIQQKHTYTLASSLPKKEQEQIAVQYPDKDLKHLIVKVNQAGIPTPVTGDEYV